ncbi:MAG: hypothetical protein HFJ54_01170 [Clostridia bacterium]|nr:hypothetical protein [Clostridia bacterium]
MKRGNYEVHKADTKTNINPDVLGLVALARLTKEAKELRNCIYGGKRPEDIRKDKLSQRIEKRKGSLSQEIGEER